MLTYHNQTPTSVEVFLDKKYVGSIKKVEGGWQYTPKRSKDGGDVFKTLQQCKHSLEEE